ncbi:Gfo/Idh/MocA family protein [Campylobacter sp.]|uniref:Gfo/Idh/MocA family protein n=1 Tax=Campylobacter sp. TaxID=205 RepID=UPI003F9FA4B2
MKALILGYGSIGKRHCEVLETLLQIDKICLVTSQDITGKACYKSLEDVPNLDEFDYFVIATPTFLHLQNLKFLDEKVKDKIILCEKPLFEKFYDFTPKNNKIFVGYVLRFHPLLQKLKELLNGEKILYINASCGQYLPSWRNGDYTKCYSASREKGGGVLLDLSHEIDYVTWICGKFKSIQSFQGKISDLQITSDDLCLIFGKTNKNVVANISIDYLSHMTHRNVRVECEASTYELDFIKGTLIKQGDKKQIFNMSNLARNEMFLAMHKDVLGEQRYICHFSEGQDTMGAIDQIQRQNNE